MTFSSNNNASSNNGNDEVRNNHLINLVVGGEPQEDKMQPEDQGNLDAPNTVAPGDIMTLPLSTSGGAPNRGVVSPRLGPNQEMSLLGLNAFAARQGGASQ